MEPDSFLGGKKEYAFSSNLPVVPHENAKFCGSRFHSYLRRCRTGMVINMNIGIVTTWFERGAAYVSRAYMDCLMKEGHQVYIFARGGELKAKDDPKWNLPTVTWGRECVTYIDFKRWIKKHNLDILFFNEQTDFYPVVLIKKNMPTLKIGAYIDYYTERTINWYDVYDFVICNTKRHLEAMDKHKQAFYVRWGTDTTVFKPTEVVHSGISFFHSVGMSNRKGTDILLKAFIDGKLYEKSKLIVHTQVPISSVTDFTIDSLKEYNIQVIEKTVSAPGLYYMGDIYVYPTRLDGLGLTIYEALSSGMPVITTNYPPMNEIVHDGIGLLVEVSRNYCRNDAYYWPMSICDEQSLIDCMMFYINHPEELKAQKKNARVEAEALYNWDYNSRSVTDIFVNSAIQPIDDDLFKEITTYRNNNTWFGITKKALIGLPPIKRVYSILRK